MDLFVAADQFGIERLKRWCRNDWWCWDRDWFVQKTWWNQRFSMIFHDFRWFFMIFRIFHGFLMFFLMFVCICSWFSFGFCQESNAILWTFSSFESVWKSEIFWRGKTPFYFLEGNILYNWAQLDWPFELCGNSVKKWWHPSSEWLLELLNDLVWKLAKDTRCVCRVVVGTSGSFRSSKMRGSKCHD